MSNLIMTYHRSPNLLILHELIHTCFFMFILVSFLILITRCLIVCFRPPFMASPFPPGLGGRTMNCAFSITCAYCQWGHDPNHVKSNSRFSWKQLWSPRPSCFNPCTVGTIFRALLSSDKGLLGHDTQIPSTSVCTFYPHGIACQAGEKTCPAPKRHFPWHKPQYPILGLDRPPFNSSVLYSFPMFL